MRTTWSDLDTVKLESRVEQEIHSLSEASLTSLTIRLARGYKCWHSLTPEGRYGARRSPLSQYMSLHLSLKLTTNCVPLSRIKWERYIFIKKCVFFVHWSSFIIFDYILGCVYEKYTTASHFCLWRYLQKVSQNNCLTYYSYWSFSDNVFATLKIVSIGNYKMRNYIISNT